MSLSRGEVMGFLRGAINSGSTLDQAKNQFKAWLSVQNEAVSTQQEKDAILSDLDSYNV